VKERIDIEQLAMRIYMDQGGEPSMELRCEVITAAVNEALEMAAKECEKEHLQEPTDSADDVAYDMAVNDCAEAIRKLKCS